MKISKGRETITAKVAYVAGFFDGEGCVRIKEANKGGNSYYVIAHITNSNLAILQEIQALFGGAIRKHDKKPNKTLYNLNLSSSEAADFLMVLLPFLREKKGQALLAIEFHERKGTMTGDMKRKYARVISQMKKQDKFPEVIGNIYENEDLLK